MISGKQETKRRHERQDFFGQVEGVGKDTRFYATVQNLSQGGLCFDVDYLLKVGQDLRLFFNTGDSPLVTLEAEVVWVQPVQMLYHRVGVKFKTMPPDMQGRLSSFITWLGQGLPGSLSGREKYRLLFSPFGLNNVALKNRITMAPMFWGYANKDGTTSQRLMDTYREIAGGGAAMVVVANAVVHPSGLVAPRTLRIDGDQFIPGLARLAETIKACGAAAGLQINHGGRWADVEKPMTPSPLSMEVSSEWEALEGMRKEMSKRHQMRLVNKFLSSFMRCRKGMTEEEIEQIQDAFAKAALRAKQAGFDMVELHGATGYLLAQFVSPRSNKRADRYGGSFENRTRFPLEVLERVKAYTGNGFPIGYRLLADEWLPGGFAPEEASAFAQSLAAGGIAYLSVTAGTYESFFLPEMMNRSRKEGYAAGLAKKVKQSVPATPVIVAGRIVGPQCAEKILQDREADLIGMARTLFADPCWPQKVIDGKENKILVCKCCNTCLFRVMRNEPVVCVRWDTVKRTQLKLELEQKRAKWERILIAMDDSENSLEVVEYAGHMIGPGKKITLFSIIREGREDDSGPIKKIQTLLAQAKGLLANAGILEQDIQTKIAAMRKGVEQDILEEVNQGKYGSVILRRRGVSRAHQVLFGSVSNYIVHHTKGCGVWVVD